MPQVTINAYIAKDVLTVSEGGQEKYQKLSEFLHKISPDKHSTQHKAGGSMTYSIKDLNQPSPQSYERAEESKRGPDSSAGLKSEPMDTSSIAPAAPRLMEGPPRPPDYMQQMAAKPRVASERSIPMVQNVPRFPHHNSYGQPMMPMPPQMVPRFKTEYMIAGSMGTGPQPMTDVTGAPRGVRYAVC